MQAALAASPVPPWPPPPKNLELERDEVHVWQAALEQPALQIQNYHRNLASDEQARAARFHFEKDRAHFIVARGVLRAILGGYVKRAPDRLSFCYGSHGKPALAGASGEEIRFNVSHSGGVALYAITRGREVGVDVERIRPDVAVAEIAERFFSRPEAAMLRTLPAAAQREAFFRCWTRKEAYIKARGEGLSLPLDQFDLSTALEEPAETPGAHQDPSETAPWSLRELVPAPGYVAALAVQSRGWRLACWQWPDPPQPSA